MSGERLKLAHCCSDGAGAGGRLASAVGFGSSTAATSGS